MYMAGDVEQLKTVMVLGKWKTKKYALPSGCGQRVVNYAAVPEVSGNEL